MPYAVVGREQNRDLIVSAYRAGVLDRWDAWVQLYNAGWRGKDLAPLYREPRWS